MRLVGLDKKREKVYQQATQKRKQTDFPRQEIIFPKNNFQTARPFDSKDDPSEQQRAGQGGGQAVPCLKRLRGAAGLKARITTIMPLYRQEF